MRFPRREALTLVELVVVLAILSMSASIVTVRLATPLRRARVDTAVEQWLNADHHARTLSRTRTVNLAVHRKSDATALLLSDASGEELRRWSFAPTVAVTCESFAAGELAQIPFPQSTSSTDYRVRFADGPIEKTIWIAGATGHAISGSPAAGRRLR